MTPQKVVELLMSRKARLLKAPALGDISLLSQLTQEQCIKFLIEFSLKFYDDESYKDEIWCPFCVVHTDTCENCLFGEKYDICSDKDSLYQKLIERCDGNNFHESISVNDMNAYKAYAKRIVKAVPSFDIDLVSVGDTVLVKSLTEIECSNPTYEVVVSMINSEDILIRYPYTLRTEKWNFDTHFRPRFIHNLSKIPRRFW